MITKKLNLEPDKYKSLIKYMIKDNPDSYLSKVVDALGLELTAQVVAKSPDEGLKLRIPSASSFRRSLLVQTVLQVFSDVENIDSKVGKAKVKYLSELFGVRKHQIRNIYGSKKYVTA